MRGSTKGFEAAPEGQRIEDAKEVKQYLDQVHDMMTATPGSRVNQPLSGPERSQLD